MTCRAPASSTCLRARDGPNAAADTTRELTRDLAARSAGCRPTLMAASRSMTCTFGNDRESPHPSGHVVVSDGEPLALNELNDRAALKIDGRDQHQVALDFVPRATKATKAHEDAKCS